MDYRVLQAPQMPDLTRACPEDGTAMTATKELYYGDHGWRIMFYCPEHEAFFPMWAPEYQSLISSLSNGVDPTTLPLRAPRMIL